DQETFQRFKSGRLHQSPFQAAPPQNLPLQRDDIGDEHLLDNVGWLYGIADAGKKLVTRGGVFPLKNLWLTEYLKPPRRGRCHGVRFGLGFPVRTNALYPLNHCGHLVKGMRLAFEPRRHRPRPLSSCGVRHLTSRGPYLESATCNTSKSTSGDVCTIPRS